MNSVALALALGVRLWDADNVPALEVSELEKLPVGVLVPVG